MSDQRHMIFEALPYPVLLLDSHMCVLDLNPAAELLIGQALNSATGQSLQNWFHKDCELMAFLARAQSDQSSRFEAGLSVEFVQGGSLKIEARIAASDKTSTTKSYVLSLFSQSFSKAFPQSSNDGGLAHQSNGGDMPLSTLVAMLAHEIKNPLSGIKGAAQLLEMSVSADEADLPTMIIDEVDRLNKLLDEMEIFSDNRKPSLNAHNIHSILGHCKGLAEVGFAKGTRCVEVYDPSLPDLYCDKDQLIQVFLNLMKNASEAIAGNVSTADRGLITLSTAYQSGIRRRTNDQRSVQIVRISIEDNGGGVPEHLRDALFQPSVSSKQGGKGFGLALAAKIIAAHEGWIDYKSDDGRTKFSVYLPLRIMPK